MNRKRGSGCIQHVTLRRVKDRFRSWYIGKYLGSFESMEQAEAAIARWKAKQASESKKPGVSAPGHQ